MLASAIVTATLVGARQADVSRDKSVERARLTQAAELDRQRRDDQIRVWTMALAADSNSAMALGQLAALHVQKARETGQETYYPVAEEMARRSLLLRTQRNGKSYVVLASTLLAQHRFSDAREAAAAAAALEPEVAQYRALLAELDMELGDYGAAAQGFAALAKYRRHLSIGPRLARWAEVSGRPASAQEILEDLLIEAEQRLDLPREQLAWFHFRLGDHYLRHGSPRRAHASLRRALDVNPGDYRAHKALADLELARGDAKAAVRHALAAVRQSRTPETLLALAAVLRESDATSEAEVIESEVAASIGPSGGSFERAWHAHRLEWDIPAAHLSQLLKTEARQRPDVQGYDLLAWSDYKSDQLPEARAAITMALRTSTSDAVVWYHAGIIAHVSGDFTKAREHFRHALRLNAAFHPRHAKTARSMLAAIPERLGPPPRR